MQSSAGEREASSALTARKLVAAQREGSISAVDAVADSLNLIQRQDKDLKAFITVATEQALAEARLADERRARGEPLGPLHGVPVAIKDTTETKGLRTTNGSPIFKDHVPEADDLVVARLKQAGAIVVGKTNMPEFGFGAICRSRVGGTTCNPYDLTRTSGGSSGGSAVAVATGMVPLAHGTDFGGSVRTPASFCGVVGVRPTIGLVPQVPKPLAWHNLSAHGVLARDAKDAALMLQVMSGGDLRDRVSSVVPRLATPEFGDPALAALRVAASVDLGICEIDQAVVRVFNNAVAQMKQALPHVVDAHPDCMGAQQAFETLRAPVVLQMLQPYFDLGPEALTETSRWNAERGRATLAINYLEAEGIQGEIYARFLDFFSKHDILAIPAACIAPWPNNEPDVLIVNGKPLRHIIDYLVITYTISLVGLPCVVIPCGFTEDGLPIGLQLVGRPFDDARLLAFADMLEQRLGFRHRAPESRFASAELRE